MNRVVAITGASIFDGERVHDDHAVIVDGPLIAGLCPRADMPREGEIVDLGGGLLAPAYVDLQVNGGGGVLFNDQPDLAGIRTICDAHARFGTGALLPTLITDGPDVTAAAIKAGMAAADEGVPGFLGLHLEGPHLAAEKKGAHRADLIRPMDDADMKRLMHARRHLPVLKITVAPESVHDHQITALSRAGVIVSLGHSASTYAQVRSAVSAGALCVTHLFNAMSPLGHREPGMVGAALRIGQLHAGIIADGFHVSPEALAIALAAKKGPGAIFLVTDAMPTVGTDMDAFVLNERTVRRRDGRLTLKDGALAGSDLDMNGAVTFLMDEVGIGLEQALNMASLYPARCVGFESRLGRLKEGHWANVIHLDERFQVNRIWIRGEPR